MKNKSYNFWSALIYEIASALGAQYPVLKKFKCYWNLLSKTKHNWLYWRVKNHLITLDDNRTITDYLKSKKQNPKF